MGRGRTRRDLWDLGRPSALSQNTTSATSKAAPPPCGLQSALKNRRSAPDLSLPIISRRLQSEAAGFNPLSKTAQSADLSLHHKGGSAALRTSVRFKEQALRA